ncbi:MAG: hypothetical protein D6759_04320 [Chloroflexi bacterium]|nr:MAG: hypothetical protein D6759_04320 [Chloroflexota bacterium]
MTKLVTPERPRTPADELRALLDRCEYRVSHLRGAGPQALELLRDLDRVVVLLATLERKGVDLRPERARLETVEGQLRHQAARFIAEVGPRLAAERPRGGRWWWHLDEMVAQQRRRARRRLVKIGLAVLVLVAIAAFLYQRFLAPPPELRAYLDRLDQGQTAFTQGDLEEAVRAFEEAARLQPEEYEPYLWLNLLYQRLGDEVAARRAFQEARRRLPDESWAYIYRGELFLGTGDLEAAAADAEAALALTPDRPEALYLAARVAALRGEVDRAIEMLQRTADLAAAQDNAQLEALARTEMAFLLQQLPQPTPTP